MAQQRRRKREVVSMTAATPDLGGKEEKGRGEKKGEMGCSRSWWSWSRRG
jgi:hypothetical protein